MATAQDIFNDMMKGEIGPALRGMGFKGSGQSFTHPSTDHWILLGFQKSTSSNRDAVRFTVNVSVGEKAAWEDARKAQSWLPERPNANVLSGPVWSQRIGLLMPELEDHWWTVSDDPLTAERAAAEVLGAIRDYAWPAIRARVDRSDFPEKAG
jgi:hypothetical protein